MHDRSNHVFRAHFQTSNRQRICKLASYLNRLFLVVHIALPMRLRHGPFFRAGRRDDGSLHEAAEHAKAGDAGARRRLGVVRTLEP